eukprot:scaffold224063_cov19-Prasinocladus_malaysianus.AAC.1
MDGRIDGWIDCQCMYRKSDRPTERKTDQRKQYVDGPTDSKARGEHQVMARLKWIVLSVNCNLNDASSPSDYDIAFLRQLPSRQMIGIDNEGRQTAALVLLPIRPWQLLNKCNGHTLLVVVKMHWTE